MSVAVHARQRLQDKVESDWNRASGHRVARETIWRAYIGDTYGLSTTNGNQVPLNGHALFARSLLVYLAAHQPRPLITTDIGPWKRHMESLGAQVSRVMREEHFGLKQQRWVLDALLYSPGILKVAQEWRMVVAGEEQEPQPVLATYVSNVDGADWVWDLSASIHLDCAYTGHRFRLPVEQFLGNPMFEHLSEEVIRSAANYGPSDRERLFFEQEDTSQPLQDVICGWEIWDRRDNKIKIWPMTRPEKLWSEEPWEGHSDGPLHYIDYLDVPNHVVGLSPLAILHNLIEATNRSLSKSIQQTDVAKNIMRITGGNKAEAEAVMQAVDGQAVFQHSGGADILPIGGPDRAVLAMVPVLRELYNWLGGNLNEIAGLGVSAPTATQGVMLQKAAGGMLKFMQSRTQESVRVAVEAMTHNELRDQVHTEVMPIGLPDGTTFWKRFTPEQRAELDAVLLNIDIDLASMQYRSPDDRLAQLLEWWNNVALPSYPITQAQGGDLDVQMFNRIYAKLKDLSEINEVYIYSGRPVPEQSGAAEALVKPPKPNNRMVSPPASESGGMMANLLRDYAAA